MSTQKNLRAIRRAISEAGGRLLGCRQGKHLKLEIDFGAGPRKLVCSVSPSDGHALDNAVRDIERMRKEALNGQ